MLVPKLRYERQDWVFIGLFAVSAVALTTVGSLGSMLFTASCATTGLALGVRLGLRHIQLQRLERQVLQIEAEASREERRFIERRVEPELMASARGFYQSAYLELLEARHLCDKLHPGCLATVEADGVYDSRGYWGRGWNWIWLSRPLEPLPPKRSTHQERQARPFELKYRLLVVRRAYASLLRSTWRRGNAHLDKLRKTE